MSSRPRPCLTGPDARRWAPWLIGLTITGVVASGYVVDRDPWIGPLFLQAGLAIAAQAVDGLRTGLGGAIYAPLPDLANIEALDQRLDRFVESL